MMNTAADGSTPNQMIANGTQASPGMGRRMRTTQAVASSAARDIPTAIPSAIPAPTPDAESHEIVRQASAHGLKPGPRPQLVQERARDRGRPRQQRRVEEPEPRREFP
jgi:hypothetical protein